MRGRLGWRVMPNRLTDETSPYLLQHAHNPVDWYPWGPDALAAAAAQDKPILLSVGYSACHWCHVMERESFENETIAARMNEDFINIKVDREERPDLDEVYMKSIQAFTGGHGGWPMTVFLTPDGRPFFGGTYFPPVPRGSMPSFPQVMDHSLRLYRYQRARVDDVAADVLGGIKPYAALPRAAEAVGGGWLDAISAAAEADFDPRWGGFGQRPKFPPHGTLSVLLAHHHTTGNERSLAMVVATLDAMARGGMYDVLGGGFARYSVDEQWLIPHFEKMLYDSALLAPLYADAAKVTGFERYARIARETLDWVLAEMVDPGGGFWSALDADSEGEEGLYYVWTPAEIEAIAGAEAPALCRLLQITPEGSFEHGRSAVRIEVPLEALSEEDRALLERWRSPLLAVRSARVRPGLDDKVIAAWNGLMISALARCGAALGESRYVEAAARAAAFASNTLTRDGRLHRTWGRGRLGAPGFLDDHAALALGFLDLWEAAHDPAHLRAALALADRMVELFWDADDGGFFYAGHDAEPLVARSKNFIGGALPSGNGLAAMALTRLDALCGREDLGERADRILRSYRTLLSGAPRALGVEALAAHWRHAGGQEVAIVGAGEADPLLDAVRARYLPFAVTAAGVEPDPELLPWLEGKTAVGGAPTAYLCRNRSCLAPTVDAADLRSALADAVEPVPPTPAAPEVRVHAPDLPADPTRWIGTEMPLTLERLRGQVVVLDFWTLCCINCMHVLPELAAVEEAFAGHPVTVIGVHSAKFPAEKEADAIERALARHHVRHPVVNDPEHDLWEQYTVKAWPTVVVVDSEGRVAWSKAGEVSRTELIAVVEAELARAGERGTLANEPAWTPSVEAPAEGLSWPGKVEVHPGVRGQALGEPLWDGGGRLYVADTGGHRILEAGLARGADGWPTATLLRTFGDGTPGRVDGPAAQARFRDPQGLARDGDSLWVADTENHSIRRVDLITGEVTTEAGTGVRGTGRPVDPERPRAAELRSPWDVTVADQAVIVAMAGSHQIWLLLPEGPRIGPFVGSGAEDHIDGSPEKAALAQPSGVQILGPHLFWVDSETSSVRVADLGKREVMTLMGRGLFDFGDVDGAPSEARMQHPLGITLAGGELYVADTFNGKIKAVDLSGGPVRTVACGLVEPGGLAGAGEFLIVADTGNHRIVAVRRADGEVRELPVLGTG